MLTNTQITESVEQHRQAKIAAKIGPQFVTRVQANSMPVATRMERGRAVGLSVEYHARLLESQNRSVKQLNASSKALSASAVSVEEVFQRLSTLEAEVEQLKMSIHDDRKTTSA